jgi:hypothetical protein
MNNSESICGVLKPSQHGAIIERDSSNALAMEKVSLADILEKLSEIIQYYSALPHPSLAMLVSCWIANTYTYREFQYCGYLALRSATPRCGKSRLLRLIGMFCHGHPKLITMPTAAVIYRGGQRILLLDEVDKLKNSDKDTYGAVLAVLNSGFEKDGRIERTDRNGEGKFIVQAFDVYGPKAFAGIESLADTLADRTFHIQMARSVIRMPRIKEQGVRGLGVIAARLRGRLETWAMENRARITDKYEQLPTEVDCLKPFDDRFQDIAESLVVLATLADEDSPQGNRIVPMLVEGLMYAAGRRVPSAREKSIVKLLDLLSPRLKGNASVFIPSEQLVALCHEADELAWIESQKMLAGFLKHFDLYPEQSPDRQCRGYTISQEWIAGWSGRYSLNPAVA